MSLQPRKLEYTDFSGGMTENDVPGNPKVYLAADNFIITPDAHLESRPGSEILGSTNYQLATGRQRVNALIPFDADSELFAVSGQNFQYQNSSSVWQNLLGPESGLAFLLNSDASHVAHFEWRKHLFLVPDGGGAPQKVYRDSTGAIKLRQAGLPQPEFTPVYSTSQYLSAAIDLAYDICQMMISHMGSAGGYHAAAHASAVAALSALSRPRTLAQLLTYTATLLTQYTAHIDDALTLLPSVQAYHIGTAASPLGLYYGAPPILNVELDASLASPTDIDSTVAVLNDLRNKYNFHIYAQYTHDYGVLAIGSYPVVTPILSNPSAISLSDTNQALLDYVNNIRAEYEAHLASAGVHDYADTANSTTYAGGDVIPDATDLHSAVVLLAWLEANYWGHYSDSSFDDNGSNQAWTSFTATSTSGSATVTASTINGNSFIGYRLSNVKSPSPWSSWTKGNFGTPGLPTLVTGNGGVATQVVFDSSLNTTGTSVFRVTTSDYHFDLDTSSSSRTDPIEYYERVQAFDYSLTNPQAIIDAATSFLSRFKAHQLVGMTLDENIAFPAYFITQTQTSDQYNAHYASSNAGMRWPQSNITVDGVYTPTYFDTPPEVVNYLYQVVYRFDYTVGSLTYSDVSTPTVSTLLSTTPSRQNPAPLTTAADPIALSNLPALVNLSGENWDTANISVDIYRTPANNLTFYKVGSVTNGTTTFSDDVVDEILVTNQLLYTTGGVVANDEPPISKFCTLLDNTAYYGYVQDGGETFPNRVRQSIQYDPDSCPATFYDDLDDDLTGLSNFRGYVVAFCKSSFYRLEGQFNELGQGAITHERLSDSIGCVSHQSIVRTELGLFFCGTNGIYWTDGYTFNRVTRHLQKTYATLITSQTQRDRISASYDSATRRIVWSFMSQPTGTDCDISWILDLNWGTGEEMPFTSWSGGTSFAPSAWAFYDGQLLRGDSRGYVFKHDDLFKSDPRVDTTVAATSWGKQPVLWDFQSCATDFGSSQAKKWVTRITVQGRNESDLSLAVSHKNDDGRNGFRELTPIRERPFPVWGDPTILWGNSTCYWAYDGMMDEFRRFTAGALRCDWKTIRFTNADLIICNSDTYGTATTSARVSTIITVTFTSSTYVWPLWSVGNYSICFSNDGYVTEYPILSRSNTAITFADPSSTAPASSTLVKWQIKGIPVDERFNLTAYNLTYAILSDEQGAYHGSTSTDGGANA